MARVFGYRIGRRSFWISVAAVILLSLGLSLVLPTTSGATAFVWFLLYAWRLHDFGRSAWWAGGFMLALIAVAIGGVIAAYTLTGGQGQGFEALSAVVIGVLVFMQLGFTLWVGSVRGERGSNRFGERSTYKLGRFTI